MPLSCVNLQLCVPIETPAADAPGIVNERQPLVEPELDIKAEVQAVIVSLVANSGLLGNQRTILVADSLHHSEADVSVQFVEWQPKYRINDSHEDDDCARDTTDVRQ